MDVQTRGKPSRLVAFVPIEWQSFDLVSRYAEEKYEYSGGTAQ
jgi:hypothetical protein